MNDHPIPEPSGTFSVSLPTKSRSGAAPAPDSARWAERVPHAGRLIINADDWGTDSQTTDRTLECVLRGTVSSVSAMVFMGDSERAAAIAQERRIDAGLHLNLTTPFSAPACPGPLVERQRELARYLLRYPVSRAIFNPWLAGAFEYVVAAQIDEFRRLYQKCPDRLDGHHHMHLSANVLMGGLLPPGTIVRRHFSFEPGEKALRNSLFRCIVGPMLAYRHRVVDFLFSLQPLEPLTRLQRIFSLARRSLVEVETHPVNRREYRFLASGEIFRLVQDLPIASRFAVPCRGHSAKGEVPCRQTP